MSKNTKDNVLGFIFMVILAVLAVFMVIRDVDKDVERTCGMKRFKNAPQMCVEWWNDKGVKNNDAADNIDGQQTKSAVAK